MPFGNYSGVMVGDDEDELKKYPAPQVPPGIPQPQPLPGPLSMNPPSATPSGYVAPQAPNPQPQMGQYPAVSPIAPPTTPRTNAAEPDYGPALPGSVQEAQLKKEQDDYKAARYANEPHHTFGQKFGHVMGEVGGDLLAAVSPRIAATIPATPYGREAQQERDTKNINEAQAGQSEADLREAQAAEARRNASASDWVAQGEPIVDAQGNAYQPEFNRKSGEARLTPLARGGAAQGATPPAGATGTPPTAGGGLTRLGAPPNANTLLPADRIPQLNASLQDRYQVLNPGKTLPPEMTLAPNATQADFERVDKIMQQTEAAQGTQAQRELANQIRQQTANITASNQTNTRLDRSYQFQSTQLEKLETPIRGVEQRLTTLASNIQQKNPQADSLIAPELLSITTGGQGTGLRMNEAEIARIVGGRSHWEDLKAMMLKWQSNPQAVSITDDQRGQIRNIVDAMNGRIREELNLLDGANEDLLDADNVQDQRRVIVNLQKKFDAFMTESGEETGGGGAGTGGGATAPKEAAPAGGTPPPRPSGVPASAVWNQGARQWQLPK